MIMGVPNRFVAVLREIHRETRPEAALETLCQAAREVTASRHCVFAMLNEEAGDLEVRFGAGPDWVRLAKSRRFTLGTEDRSGIAAVAAATRTSVVREGAGLFEDAGSEIAVPIRDQDSRLRAVLVLDRDTGGFADHRETLEGFAEIAGLVLDRAEQDAREEALIQVGGSLDQVLTETALVERVIRTAEETLRLASCSLFLLDPRTELLTLRGTIGALKENMDSVSYALGEGFTGWVAQHGESILLDDPQTDPRWRGKFVEIPSPQIASFLAVPILSRGKALGVIRALRRKPENPFVDNRFSNRDLRLLQAIAEQVSAGLEIARGVERLLRDERMIAWGELSAKSSHMIGNRVFALKGDVNELKHLLNESEMDRPALVEVQGSLQANLGRIDEILQDFRDFLTATQIKRNPTDVNGLVRETADEVFPKRSEVKLDFELEEGLPSIEGDDTRLRRAVSELIENALHHCSVGTIHLRTRRDGSNVKIEVQDCGPGIEEGKKAMVFQPFYSGRVRGMGLGLSIVKGIIDAHGGEVRECGVPGEGACFVMTLPAARDHNREQS
ncbi:GAF domain-containing protein [bacterium]|nr:MAG: GAF domain-containing protein [bacterium]